MSKKCNSSILLTILFVVFSFAAPSRGRCEGSLVAEVPLGLIGDLGGFTLVCLFAPWPGARDGSVAGFIAGNVARSAMTAGGVYLGGDLTGGHGEFLSAFLGALVGSAFGLGLIPGLPTIGALIGYAVTDHKSDSKSDGKSALGSKLEPIMLNLFALPS